MIRHLKLSLRFTGVLLAGVILQALFLLHSGVEAKTVSPLGADNFQACGINSHAGTISLPLSGDCWNTLSPWGGSSVIVESSGGIRFSGSDTRKGTQTYFGMELDYTHATVYIKWRAHGPSGSYGAWGIGVGSVPDAGSETASFHGIATTGWTSPRHGAGFTTKNSWSQSEVIQDDLWYYTRISITPQKLITAATATGNYDDAGGTLFYGYTYGVGDTDLIALSNASVFATFNDNYGGTNAWMEIGEVTVVRACSDLCLDVETDGTQVDLRWTPVTGAEGYTLYYAFPDTLGEIDITTLGAMNMDTRTSINIDFPSGMGLFAAVMAHGSGGDILSNIQQFMPFGGEITFPSSGAMLMQLTDPGGIGNYQVTATETAEGPGLPVQKIDYESGLEHITFYFDQTAGDGINLSGKTGMFLTYQDSGNLTYDFKVNGRTKYEGTIADTRTKSPFLDYPYPTTRRSNPVQELLYCAIVWDTPDFDEPLPDDSEDKTICHQTRSEYENWLNREDPELTALKKGFHSILVNLYNPAIHRAMLKNSDALQFFTWILEDMLRETAKSIVELHNQKLAHYDKVCQGTGDDNNGNDTDLPCTLENSRYTFRGHWVSDKSDYEDTTTFTCNLESGGLAACANYDCTWQQAGSNFELNCESDIYSYHVIYSGYNVIQPECAINGTMERIDSPEYHGTFEGTARE